MVFPETHFCDSAETDLVTKPPSHLTNPVTESPSHLATEPLSGSATKLISALSHLDTQVEVLEVARRHWVAGRRCDFAAVAPYLKQASLSAKHDALARNPFLEIRRDGSPRGGNEYLPHQSLRTLWKPLA